MSAKGDLKKLVRDVKQAGFSVEIEGAGGVYEVRDRAGNPVAKISWTAGPELERRKLRAALRKHGITL